MTPNDQLDLRSRHSDFQTFLDINENESERVRKSYPCYLDEKYGPEPLQTLDLFPSSTPDSPILIFIHGGYWRALDKRSYSFVAEPFIKNNFNVCIINYRLIPSVTMKVLLSDVAAAISWVQNETGHINGDSKSITLCGHSAGGHLALMTYILNAKLRANIKAMCSLSGIFDLGPIKDSYLNEVLQLSEDDVAQYSVSNKDLSVIQCPVLLSVGLGETALFIEQSKQLYHENQLKAPLQYYGYPGLNHYQIVHRLGQQHNPVVDFLLA